ncbi:MAG: hypothetical protein HY321_21385 [Armatimonadetes bacterium]|nr:hypothetical protein [Armatimonadota bacterium]
MNMPTPPGSAGLPARVRLEGVPRVRFYDGTRCPEDVPLPSCLRACLEYLGDPPGCRHLQGQAATWPMHCGYAYLMGTSGAAFRLLWNPQVWDMANGDVMRTAEDPRQPVLRAFESVGYACEILRQEEGRDNGALFRERIAASLRQGRPVIGFGVVGPPECCLITGCDEGGEALIGWSFFQDFPEFAAGLEFEPTGEFRKRDWLAETPGIVVIGERGERPESGEVFRRALDWAIRVTRTPRVRHRRAGLAAYGAWAEALLRDDQFAGQELAVLHDRYMVHYDATGTVAEGRWYASLFLRQIAASEPAAAAPLERAAACYVAEHDLMWAVWEFAGGNGVSDAHVRKLAEPRVRRRIVPLIHLAREKDEQAAGHLEEALLILMKADRGAGRAA